MGGPLSSRPGAPLVSQPSAAAVLRRALPATLALASGDPLELRLWGGGDALAERSLVRLRRAAAASCLRGFAEAVPRPPSDEERQHAENGHLGRAAARHHGLLRG